MRSVSIPSNQQITHTGFDDNTVTKGRRIQYIYAPHHTITATPVTVGSHVRPPRSRRARAHSARRRPPSPNPLKIHLRNPPPRPPARWRQRAPGNAAVRAAGHVRRAPDSRWASSSASRALAPSRSPSPPAPALEVAQDTVGALTADEGIVWGAAWQDPNAHRLPKKMGKGSLSLSL